MGVLPHAVCVLTAAVALVLYYVALKFLASVSEYKEFTAAQLGVAVFYGLSIAAWAGVEAGFLAARCVGTRRPNAHQTLKTRAQTTVAGKSRDSRQARTLCERVPSVAVLLVRAGARTRPGRRENVSYPRALVCVCTPRASTSSQVARHLYKGAAYPARAVAVPGTWGYAKDVFTAAWNALPDVSAPDLEAAKALVAEAGAEGHRHPVVQGNVVGQRTVDGVVVEAADHDKVLCRQLSMWVG